MTGSVRPPTGRETYPVRTASWHDLKMTNVGFAASPSRTSGTFGTFERCSPPSFESQVTDSVRPDRDIWEHGA